MDSPSDAPSPPWKLLFDGLLATIATNESIDLTQARISWRYLSRGGQRIALDVSVHGPRRMRPHAIWSWTEGKILFYDSGGKRWREDEVDPAIQPNLEQDTGAYPPSHAA